MFGRAEHAQTYQLLLQLRKFYIIKKRNKIFGGLLK
jgi:hypothetical protein